MINLTTGPVELSQDVLNAFQQNPISHRSEQFHNLHKRIVDKLCNTLNVKDTFLLQGSGTLANEVMLWQIKSLKTKGLILSNGEFGDRLIDQAKRIQLEFENYTLEWGKVFDNKEVEARIQKDNLKWILFVHCETSTGVINPLQSIVNVAKNNQCHIFLDCISTIGTQEINLTHVTMATGSSGKGLCALAGIGLIFSNMTLLPENTYIPKYFDLRFYSKRNGIPFTLSSNLLYALHAGVCKTMDKTYWLKKDRQALRMFNFLKSTDFVPYAKPDSRVYTIVQNDVVTKMLYQHLYDLGLQFSYQSDYLLDKNWIQFTLFGDHNDEQIEYIISVLEYKLTLVRV